MERAKAAELIREKLPTIYGYAFARVYNKNDADDLASEIVLALLESAEKIRSEDAFWSFTWRLAENCTCAFIRRRRREQSSILPPEELLEPEPSSEDVVVTREAEFEEIYLVRRELSLLTRTHREVSVAYYSRGLSCGEIAREYGLTVDNVKYHLFKTRKLLKEGIGMTRTLGEKSYNPGIFRLDFWGDWNHYNELFRRKLPGSIVLAAYYTPLTAEELSLELGVAMPYLEDELDILVKAGVLTYEGGKYRTALVIFTEAFDEELARATEGSFKAPANAIFERLSSLLGELRTLDFTWNDRGDNELLLMALNIALLEGWSLAGKRSPLGEAKPLKLGGNGWLFGYDNDYKNGHFLGITMHSEPEDDSRAWFSAENYLALKDCGVWSHSRFADRVKLTVKAIMGDPVDDRNPALASSLANGDISCIDGCLKANFAVFSEDSLAAICRLLAPVSELVCEAMLDYAAKAAELLASHVPAAVRSQCDDIVKIHCRMDVMALLLEELLASGLLAKPTARVPAMMFGVRR